MVGGAGEKFILCVVAQYADWWNYIYQDRPTYVQKQEVLKEHCRAVGRDYEEIVQVTASNLLVAENDEAVKKLVEAPHVRPVGANGFAGTPAQVTERLLTAVDQGAKRINVSFSDTPRLESTQLFIEEVLPHLKV
jgi:alkanesulfonate monooxygenase SsuD/methylene tetrahydromethanopterin reductase-like flavin-dependent oxidoreductase (luciferase family)